MRRLVVLGLLLFVPLTLLGGCKAKSSSKPKVVATFSVLGDLVTNVAGDKVEVVTLVGPDSDAHTFDPKTDDAAAVGDAVAIFEIGAGFEKWLDKIYKTSSSKGERAVLSKDLKLQAGADDDEHDNKDPKHKHDHDKKDPHVWHDVKNVIIMVGTIKDQLVKVDPANAEYYKNRAKEYVKKLEELDAWIVKEVASLPKERRKLVTNHDSLGYFASRYGFEIIGDAFGSTTTEGQELPPDKMAELVEKIKKAGVPVIFAENVESNKMITKLAKEAKVEVGPELYTDALSKADSPGGTYEKMMRHNVTSIVTGLKK